MDQAHVSAIVATWCVGIHANTRTNSRFYRELRIAEFNGERLVEVKATSNVFEAIADCSRKVVLVLASDLSVALD